MKILLDVLMLMVGYVTWLIALYVSIRVATAAYFRSKKEQKEWNGRERRRRVRNLCSGPKELENNGKG